MYINGIIKNIDPISYVTKPLIYNINMCLDNNDNDNDNINNNNTISKLNIIPGLGLGIPLNIIQYIFTYIHYNYNIVNLNLIFLQFGIGITTYGTDRFLDSFSIDNTTTKDKLIYYNYLQNNKNNILLILLCSYIYVSTNILYYDNTDEVFALLFSTLFYKTIKQK